MQRWKEGRKEAPKGLWGISNQARHLGLELQRQQGDFGLAYLSQAEPQIG